MNIEHTEMDLQSDKPLLNILGNKVALGPVQKHMSASFLRWQNDFRVTLFSGDAIRPNSQEDIEASRALRERDGSQRFVEFAIYERETMRLIGSAHWRRIDRTNRTADYGILIGEPDCWGKGYGTEVTILMLDYAFTVLGLHSVVLWTSSYNERGIRAYTRAGFRVIGRQREALRLGDQVYDLILMDCLSSEFRSPLKRIIDLP